MTQSPDTLFHYAPFGELEDLLAGRIAFEPPSRLDDPAEIRPWSGDVYADLPLADLEAMIAHLAGELATAYPAAFPHADQAKRRFDARDRRRISAFLAETAELFLKAVDRSVIILLASADGNNPLLWHRRAAGHRGLAIGIDPAHPVFQEGSVAVALPGLSASWFPVSYQEARPAFIELGLNGPDEPKLAAILAYKNPIWQGEREWRLIRYADKAEDDVYYASIPHQAVRSLTFGLRVDAVDMARAVARIRAEPQMAHVRLYRALPSVEYFGCVYSSID